jgi:hypothetical protein
MTTTELFKKHSNALTSKGQCLAAHIREALEKEFELNAFQGSVVIDAIVYYPHPLNADKGHDFTMWLMTVCNFIALHGKPVEKS